MAKYMVEWSVPRESRNEAIKRFGTDASKAPAGLEILGRWHTASIDAGYVLVEASNPKDIANWVLQWSDLLPYEVRPVITDEELGDLLERHKLF